MMEVIAALTLVVSVAHLVVALIGK